MEATDKIKIQDFITNNNIDLSGEGSDLNGNCVILCGYLLHIGVDIEEFLAEDGFDGFDGDVDHELRRVYEFANDNNYGDWWTTKDAKLTYKF
jgi:hypothetical protein